MKWKNRLTNYNFWISIVSAVLLLLQAFDFEFDILYVNEILTAVLGLLVVIGIISDPTRIMVDGTNKKAEDKIEAKEPITPVEIIPETNDKAEEPKLDMPIEEESATDAGIVEIDLQAVINKIKEDLDNIRAEMYSPISSALAETPAQTNETKIEDSITKVGEAKEPILEATPTEEIDITDCVSHSIVNG